MLPLFFNISVVSVLFMKLKSCVRFFLLLAIFESCPGYAATFKSFFDIIYSKSDSTVVEVINDSKDSTHIFSVSVFEIDNPIDRNPIQSSNLNAVTFTPTKQIVKPGSSARVKFIYNGPKDDKERYFSIKWNDATLKKSAPKSSAQVDKSGSVYVNTSINTTLIVNPRIEKTFIKYKDGHVINDGNATVDLYVNGLCGEKGETCSLSTPILPTQNVSVKHFKVDKDFNVGYWVSENDTRQVNVSG